MNICQGHAWAYACTHVYTLGWKNEIFKNVNKHCNWCLTRVWWVYVLQNLEYLSCKMQSLFLFKSLLDCTFSVLEKEHSKEWFCQGYNSPPHPQASPLYCIPMICLSTESNTKAGFKSGLRSVCKWPLNTGGQLRLGGKDVMLYSNLTFLWKPNLRIQNGKRFSTSYWQAKQDCLVAIADVLYESSRAWYVGKTSTNLRQKFFTHFNFSVFGFWVYYYVLTDTDESS